LKLRTRLDLKHFVFETLHSAFYGEMDFAYASWARPTLALSAASRIFKVKMR
jgi:hypothetical protein